MRYRILLLVTIAALMGCRHRAASPAPAVVPPPAVASAEPAPQPVAPPAHDFVSEKPAADELPADVVELDRVAHEKGWLHDAFFDYDRSALRDDAQEALTRSAEWLRGHANVAVVLEGHCDERGTEQYNLALGDHRAHTAQEFLTALGIDASRVRTVSYGEERPFAEGHDESAWSQNRRAHITVTRR